MVRPGAARQSGAMTTDTPRRLVRSTSDRKLGGVAGGLGAYFSVDPILFRVGFVVATLMTGVGAIAYLALLAFLPTDAGDPPMLGARPATA
jgi:phage shock protein PspC (stress-responsive transcriptional regulator)